MKILAIDTSCDDTCIAIIATSSKKQGLKDIDQLEFKILSNIVSSQVKIHQKYGGVVPILAKREHQKNLIPILKESLKKIGSFKKSILKKISASKKGVLKNILNKENKFYQEVKRFLEKHQKPRIDLIAVTQGPGLEPALWPGINFARALSFFWNIPIVPINHIESHIFANFINNKTRSFPAIALVVSGGHTELFLMKGIGEYQLIGETKDDAAGECLDKIAKILGLPYPGGPAIEKLAREGKDVFHLPRPMIFSKDCNFSFSGLKTAVLYLTRKIPVKKLRGHKLKANIAASAQQAVIDALMVKTIKVAKDCKIKTIFLGGGVVANNELKKQFKRTFRRKYPLSTIHYPPAKFCTDNAVMVGVSAYFNFLKYKPTSWRKAKAIANLKI